MRYILKPNFKELAKLVGKDFGKVVKAIKELNKDEPFVKAIKEAEGKWEVLTVLGHDLDSTMYTVMEDKLTEAVNVAFEETQAESKPLCGDCDDHGYFYAMDDTPCHCPAGRSIKLKELEKENAALLKRWAELESWTRNYSEWDKHKIHVKELLSKMKELEGPNADT